MIPTEVYALACILSKSEAPSDSDMAEAWRIFAELKRRGYEIKATGEA